MKLPKTTPRPGRPRAFDAEKALESALQVFWEKGYEGASLSDLTAAMKINRPSLYAAFGNKEALFHAALDRYAKGTGCLWEKALSQPTARGVVEQLLRPMAEQLGDPDHPRGCLMVQSALCGGEEANAIRKELTLRRIATATTLRKRFERAKKEGDLPASANPADLARYISAITYGLSIEAVNGATRAELLRVVEIVLKAWPS